MHYEYCKANMRKALIYKIMDKDNIPKWKQYEWLIMKIMHNVHSCLEIEVIYDSALLGKYSEVSRQIDILITNKEANIKTAVECKNYKNPIDVKGVESFISMMSDINADFGVMIASSGFTKAAKNRVSEYEEKIKLEHLSWINAYESSFNKIEYGRIRDICAHCSLPNDFTKSVPGLLCWGSAIGIWDSNGKVSIGQIGKCIKCNSITVYCDSCGCLSMAKYEEPCCELRDKFINCI